MATRTLSKLEERGLSGICNHVASEFVMNGFNIKIYPEKMDEKDLIERTDINFLVYGKYNGNRNFFRVLDKLEEKGLRVVSHGNSGKFYKTSDPFQFEFYCLFEYSGKRIKIRDRTDYKMDSEE